jgi:hypothetical protein
MLMSSHAIPPASVDAAIERAAGRVAPLWPLQDFVAVNPFLGYAGEGLAQTAEQMARAAGARVLMPLSFYAEAIQAGRITMADLAKARTGADRFRRCRKRRRRWPNSRLTEGASRRCR